MPVPAPKSDTGEHRGARTDLIPLEEKIKMEEEATAARLSNLKYSGDTIEAARKSDSIETSKEQAKKIAEKAGPRKCYSYFEFERLHLRRSRA